MKTVGQVLRETRESKHYTLEEVEKQIKIRKELLEALENDDYDKLPPVTFVQGFIKNYGKFLNLDTNKLLAIFRRGFETSKHPPLILESFSRPIKEKKFRITPAQVIGATLGVIIIIFFAYLWFEYRQFAGAPNLVVDSPRDQQTVEIPTILVSGHTDPEVTVSINDQDVGVDSSGHFEEEVKLAASVNTITVTATSHFGQTAKITRTVIVQK